MPPYRLGIDIGGTFTDGTLLDEATGQTWMTKVLTTPQDPSLGFISAASRLLSEVDVRSADVQLVVHATTVATNAIIEGKFARTALVTTEGFSDILEIGRQMRPSLYDLLFVKPLPMVPRDLTFGVRERISADGEILTPLDMSSVRTIGQALRKEGVETVAVCLLHAYYDSSHEIAVRDELAILHPDALISISSDVAPEFREYSRASTTVINAAVRPVVRRYIDNIRRQLDSDGIACQLLVMQSNGGVYSSAAAAEKPVFMVESGPAAGVMAAAFFGDLLGLRNVLSFDMGGTTAKVGLVLDGSPRITKDYEVGAVALAGSGGNQGTGYPIRTPVIDLVEIGAGGGSIAWVDSGGVLRVGPQSAGADPGPACYGSGGDRPTVTDANLVLGRLNPEYFLGGEMELDRGLAEDAIEKHCSKPLSLSVVQAASGIVEIANAAMVNALRLMSVQRGYDPRDFVLVGFGGAGPIHVNRLAAEVRVPLTVIPLAAGITSSVGLLATDIKHDYAVTRQGPADDADAGEMEDVYLRLETQAREELAREGIDAADMTFSRVLEMRYVGQSFELGIELRDGEPGSGIHRLVEAFHVEHERTYGFAATGEPIEVVTLRLTGRGAIPRPITRRLEPHTGPVDRAEKTRRPVYFVELDGFTETPVYDRYRLGAGATIRGPAVVEERDSTTVVHPGFGARVDEYGNLVLAAVDVEHVT